jgi:hypothetical protein
MTEHNFVELKARAERVINDSFGGTHHVRSLKFFGPELPMCSFLTTELATWDRGNLTALVVSSHDQCLRCEISNGGPNRLKVELWPRLRHKGGEEISSCCPLLEDHIKLIRGQITSGELIQRMQRGSEQPDSATAPDTSP